MVVLGAGGDTLEIDPVQLLVNCRSVRGAITGSAADCEDALAFSVLEDVRPVIETFPLEKATEAYARMMSNKARFRAVLTM